MSKLLSVIFIGAILALVPFFFFFIGLKLNYIDYYNIKEYYNIIFVDNMPWDIYGYAVFVLGALFVFPKKLYFGGIVLMLLMGASVSTFIPAVGKRVASDLFAKPNFQIKKGKHLYKGILLYEGRHYYHFRKADTNKTIPFRKDEVDETY